MSVRTKRMSARAAGGKSAIRCSLGSDKSGLGLAVDIASAFIGSHRIAPVFASGLIIGRAAIGRRNAMEAEAGQGWRWRGILGAEGDNWLHGFRGDTGEAQPV